MYVSHFVCFENSVLYFSSKYLAPLVYPSISNGPLKLSDDHAHGGPGECKLKMEIFTDLYKLLPEAISGL